MSISVKSAATNLLGVKVYPNPYKHGTADAKFDRPQGIRFDNLTNKVKIKIFNIAAELVFEKDIESTAGTFDWTATNNSGNSAASGVYIYYITNSDDTTQKAISKFAIIR